MKPITPECVFFQDYFNDLICIPFWLPLVLFLHKSLGIRITDGAPTKFELIAHLVVWSIMFEVIGPKMNGVYWHTTADPWDVVAYTIGAGTAAILWGSLRINLRCDSVGLTTRVWSQHRRRSG